MTFFQILKTSFISTINQVIANYGYYRALNMTSTNSGTLIFTFSSVFAYVLSLFVLGERFSLIKAIAVVLAFGGVAAITLSDEENNEVPPGSPPPWIGDVVMAGAALFWALYLVCYKKLIGEPNFGTINLQSTLVGIINILFLCPILFILHYTNVETFELPTGFTLELVLVTTGLAFINNYLYTFGTAVTSPVYVTIGGMLAIPGSALVDCLFFNSSLTVYKIVGTIIMGVAFLLVNLNFKKMDKN